MADLLSNALSSLVSNQRALATTSHNIANAGTEGYSRQEVSFSAQNGTSIGGLTIGSGVKVSEIRRMYDQFAISQLRAATAASSQLEVQHDLATQLDNNLADPDLGLTAFLSQFYNSIQDVANEPASLSARQLFLAEAQTLGNRFNDVSAQIDSLDAEISERVDSAVAEINDLTSQIADINKLLSESSAVVGGGNSDLLDQRDQAILKLSALVNISSAEQDDGSINIFIGRGDALVLGGNSTELSTIRSAEDPARREIVLANNTGFDLTDSLNGGSLGGALSFQREIIDVTRNELGRIAVSVATALNDQNNAGLDLYGQRGQDIFSIAGPRVSQPSSNTGGAALTATITDTTALTAQDIELRFNGASWQAFNQQSGAQITGFTGSGTVADPFVIDGVSISVSGAANAGDRFYIKPTVDAAGSFSVVMTDPSRIAAAAATRSEAVLSNTGSAKISETLVVDPSNPNLMDPVSISFIDATTYQINGAGSFAYTSGNPIVINGNQVTINGIPNAGDSFNIAANTGANGDNRNAMAMAATEDLKNLVGGTQSINDAVGALVGKVAVYTRSTEVNLQAQENLKYLASERQASVSGVNLDEEAANLIRYQQAYSAAAQAISTANDLFQSLMGAFR
ncbi:flagellar hook-associated protein FlgK [Spongiibacter sp. KMU-158]|uniref:Flagellar hook-associated protein 1 n=1 Tax=Spongiibacter pelagi TaxID=2760804 RepID=A0A927BZG5_9GAMM|nr:flagellar hook-associated protein FlgK [Spongiibacter pelagi]MBD2858420.1 flagellar hook-associated protein FlgK [Spongiibacter pelagi]